MGYYTDPAMQGLVLCGQRWYAPAYERWLSRDPIGYDGGANLYEYCCDNPVGGIDPNGTDVYVIGYGGGSGLGSHAAIGVTWPGSHEPVYFSYGPGVDPNKYYLAFKANSSVRSQVLYGFLDPADPTVDGEDGKADICVDVPCSAADDYKIRKWLLPTEGNDDGFGGSYGPYDGKWHQCSSYVNDAIKAAIDTGLPRVDPEPLGGVDLGEIIGGILSPVNRSWDNVVSPANIVNWAKGQPGASVTYLSKQGFP